MPGSITKAVLVHPPNFDHYLHEDVYVKVYQILHPYKHTHDIYEAHTNGRAEASRNYRYDYARGMMTTFFFNAVSLKGATYTTAMHRPTA